MTTIPLKAKDYRSGIEPDEVRQKLGISKIQWREIHLKLRQLSEML